MGLEQIAAVMLASGLVCLTIAAVWIWIVGWKVYWGWGLALTLFAPAAAVFIPKHFTRVRRPFWLMMIGAVFVGVPFVINAVASQIDLGPREKTVDGELHVTLTGWDQSDYSVLRARPNMVVLQMANADVTDETLEFLRDMQQLKELDVNDTQITDKGLSILKQLPALASLRLRGTKITDAGFQSELAGKESLMELDVRETPVESKTMRTWKNAREGRKYLK